MGKIKGIAAGIEELLSKPIAEAAISVAERTLNDFISSAKNLGAAPADIKKLEKIQKRKRQASLGKPKPKGGSATVSEVERINTDFKFGDKSGSAAIKAFRKSPITRPEMMEAIKAEAKELGLSPSITAAVVKSANKWWMNIRHAANPTSMTPAEFRKSRMTPKELLQNRLAELKIQKPKLSGDDKMRAAAKFPSFSSVVDISKMKSLDEYTNNILKFAKDRYRSIGVKLPSQVSDNLINRAAIAWAKRTKVKPTKPTKPFKKGGSVKRPSMQKGGSYKGKKHSYIAGGKVNKLKF